MFRCEAVFEFHPHKITFGCWYDEDATGGNSSTLVPGEGNAPAVWKESPISSLECPSQEGLVKGMDRTRLLRTLHWAVSLCAPKEWLFSWGRGAPSGPFCVQPTAQHTLGLEERLPRLCPSHTFSSLGGTELLEPRESGRRQAVV